MTIEMATTEDAEEILRLQKLAYTSEAIIYNDFLIQPLLQTLEETRDEIKHQFVLKYEGEKGIMGSVRGYSKDNTTYIGKLIVHPRFQNTGIGTLLMKEIEGKFPLNRRFEIFTGHKSQKNLHLYDKLGYKQYSSKIINEKLTLIYLEKFNTPK
jgi:ribosomal protein S18 acetylase RimI-like enzyme